ncbi:MAG: Hsp70 family protein [Pseudomonadota bacterium]
MSQSDSWVVCIDFGTSASKAALARRNPNGDIFGMSVRPLAVGVRDNDGLHRYLIPSIIYIEDDQIYFGRSAQRMFADSEQDDREFITSFKLMLGPRGAFPLTTRLSRRIDPGGIFTYRDLLVLYLAYFLRAIEHSILEQSDVGRDAQFSYRYARPAQIMANGDAQIMGILKQAKTIAAVAGQKLDRGQLSVREGVELVLESANSNIDLEFEASITETAAAASALYATNHFENTAILVVDCGAGTTDYGVYAWNKKGGQMEILGARTLISGGDDVDRVILNLCLEKIPNLKTEAEKAQLWRKLSSEVRDLKEKIFQRGSVTVTFGEANAKITKRQLERVSDYKAIVANMKKGFSVYSKQAATMVKKSEMQQLMVYFCGGTSRLPFLLKLASEKKSVRGMKLKTLESTPFANDALDDLIGQEQMLHRLVVAIGGAIASDGLLRPVSAQNPSTLSVTAA